MGYSSYSEASFTCSVRTLSSASACLPRRMQGYQKEDNRPRHSVWSHNWPGCTPLRPGVWARVRQRVARDAQSRRGSTRCPVRACPPPPAAIAPALRWSQLSHPWGRGFRWRGGMRALGGLGSWIGLGLSGWVSRAGMGAGMRSGGALPWHPGAWRSELSVGCSGLPEP